MGIRVITDDSVYILGLDLLGKGETARVFPAYLEGESPDQPNWAIKLAKDQEHNEYIDQEYRTLQKLKHALPDAAHNKLLPDCHLGMSTDRRKALIMRPLLRHSLLEIFENLGSPIEREKLAIAAAKQYAALLQGLNQANLSCLDRKLGDLWWVGDVEAGHLIVTDWNVINETPNQVMDLRRFGLLWFELIIGHQLPHNFQPSRRDFDQVQEKISYGLWYVIGRALGSSMGPQFHPLKELTATLDGLTSFYHQPVQTLLKRAQTNLSEAQSRLDRTKADLACMQFDIAQRLNGNEASPGLAEARNWAYDPITQAAPDLLRKFASPQFSEAQHQLRELERKVLRPQELGDIHRLQFGYALLMMARDVLMSTGELSNLTQMAQAFHKFQEILVKGVLPALITQKGAEAKTQLENMTDLLPEVLDHGDLGKLKSLEFEAILWEEYQRMQQNLHTNHREALVALANVRTMRRGINHWPDEYEPTLQDLDRLKAILAADLHANVLTNDYETTAASLDPRSQNSPTAPEARDFWLTFAEDLVRGHWIEGFIELLNKQASDPENEGFKMAVVQVAKRLRHRHKALAELRPTPGRLAERANTIEALLNLPSDLMPDSAINQQLSQELAEIRNLEEHIVHDQQELFQNPEQVFVRALTGNYELFDDTGLSVATLRAIHQAGRWDNGAFDEEIIQMGKQVERFLTMTNLVRERQEILTKTLEINPSFGTNTAVELETFIANTLRFFLTTAQAQLQVGAEAGDALARAHHLLETQAKLLPADDCLMYQEMYNHLADLMDAPSELKREIETLHAAEIEVQLERWFRSYRFTECFANVPHLKSKTQQQKWETRLNSALQIRDILERDEPQWGTNYFRKKQNSQLYSEMLESLTRQTTEAEPMALDLYKQEIESLYERLWQRLEQIDKKLAQQFKPTLDEEHYVT